MIKLSPVNLSASGEQESTWSNPVKLSRKVRELAHQSHRALKTRSEPHVADSRHPLRNDLDLVELMTQIARLQQKIHALGLRGLIPWIDALKRQVESRLGNRDRETRS